MEIITIITINKKQEKTMSEKDKLLKEIYELELTAEHNMEEKFYLLDLKSKLNDLIQEENNYWRGNECRVCQKNN
jgi:hypothetical protein